MKLKKEKKEIIQKEEIKKRNGLMGNAEDYNVYLMGTWEKIIGFLIGFVAGIIVALAFFGSIWLGVIAGSTLGTVTIKKYREHLIQKRKRILLIQFRDFLDSLASSYSSGKNKTEAFQDARGDMLQIYDLDADIVKEVSVILSGMQSNLTIENLLVDFAQRSTLEDIESFANVFEISNRQGANMKNIIASTRDIISDKIEIEMEIQTILAGNKNELNIMIVMPLVIVMSLGGLGGSTVTENTVLNVIVKIGVLCLFGLAYKMGQKITTIKV